MADMQIRLPGARTAMPPLVELPDERRAASSSRHRRGKPLGKPPLLPDPARVSSPSARARGRRWLGTVDPNLIRRPQTPDTGSAAAAADSGPGLSARPAIFPPVAPAQLGRPAPDGPDPPDPARAIVFLEFSL
jgi:hypothetical protein